MFKMLNKKDRRSFKQFGISRRKIKALKKNRKYGVYQECLFGRKIRITHQYWFAHSVEEIFFDEIYKFESEAEDPFIIDCGANWGLSIIYFKNLYPKARMIAFEADERIFKILKSNIKEFQFSNVQLLNKAVWTNDSEIEFSCEGSLGGSITSLGISSRDRIKIESFRLKSLLEKNKVHFLKIDIEGAEYDVLQDCKDHLNNVKTLFVEYHSLYKSEQKLDELLSILKMAGFRYYIKEAANKLNQPFIDNPKDAFDMQLNIFAYRPNLP
jgi:FkbM family methyltransferase